MDINEFLPPAPAVDPEQVTAKPAKKKPAQRKLLETPEKLEDAPESWIPIEFATPEVHAAAKEVMHAALNGEKTDTEEKISRPLYEMVEDYRQLVDYLVLRDGVMDEESIAAWDSIRGTISDKLENCGKMLRELALRKDSTEIERNRLSTRVATIGNSYDRLKEYIKAQMINMDEMRFEGLTLNCSVYDNGHACEIIDELRVPDEFCTVSVKMTAAEWTKAGAAVMAIIGKTELPVSRSVNKKAVVEEWKNGAGAQQIAGTIVETRKSIRVY